MCERMDEKENLMMERRRRYRRRCIRTAVSIFVLVIGGIAIGVQLIRQQGRGLDIIPATHQTGELADGSKSELESSGEETLTDQEKLRIIQTDSAYPERLAEFAEKSPEAIDYVYHYPQRYGQHFDIDLSQEASAGTVPLLMQWDERWGYEDYGDGQIGYTGCGPTCISMAALYLTGDAQWTPLKVAQIADENGYYVDGAGSSWTLMSEGVACYGLRSEVLPLDEGRMKSALDSGGLIILNVGEGDFTSSGHFILITGYGDGGFTVNDPNSVSNSETSWSYETLKGQIKNLWGIWKE